jgi:hypothetical protein
MKLVLAEATRGIPTVLSGSGSAAAYRNQTLEALLNLAAPTVIREMVLK